jgi:hypothetical protein
MHLKGEKWREGKTIMPKALPSNKLYISHVNIIATLQFAI